MSARHRPMPPRSRCAGRFPIECCFGLAGEKAMAGWRAAAVRRASGRANGAQPPAPEWASRQQEAGHFRRARWRANDDRRRNRPRAGESAVGIGRHGGVRDGIACHAFADRDRGAHLGLHLASRIAIGQHAAKDQAHQQHERGQQDELQPQGHLEPPRCAQPDGSNIGATCGKAKLTAGPGAFREFFP
jgi:hypothetical protein